MTTTAMTITTTFNTGDTIWVLANNTVKLLTVESIRIDAHGVSYQDSKYNSYPEQACYASVNDMIAHIRKQAIQYEYTTCDS